MMYLYIQRCHASAMNIMEAMAIALEVRIVDRSHNVDTTYTNICMI